MIAGRHSEDHYYPITWVGRVPIYATTLLVAIHVLAMVGTALAMSFSGLPAAMCPWLTPLFYSSASVLQHFSIWQFISYAFIHEPSIWFAIEMWLLYSFGREVEKFIGRSAFLWLYAALLLAAPIALTLLSLVGVPSVLGGSFALHFAIFVAFVVIYPSAEILFSVQAKWVALVLLVIYSLQDVASNQWTSLGVLWLECACAVLMLRASGATNAAFESLLPARWDDEPASRRRKAPRCKEASEPDFHISIDPLLEKISKHGIDSLTKCERQRLEQARADLLERENHSHR